MFWLKSYPNLLRAYGSRKEAENATELKFALNTNPIRSSELVHEGEQTKTAL